MTAAASAARASDALVGTPTTPAAVAIVLAFAVAGGLVEGGALGALQSACWGVGGPWPTAAGGLCPPLWSLDSGGLRHPHQQRWPHRTTGASLRWGWSSWAPWRWEP